MPDQHVVSGNRQAGVLEADAAAGGRLTGNGHERVRDEQLLLQLYRAGHAKDDRPRRGIIERGPQGAGPIIRQGGDFDDLPAATGRRVRAEPLGAGENRQPLQRHELPRRGRVLRGLRLCRLERQRQPDQPGEGNAQQHAQTCDDRSRHPSLAAAQHDEAQNRGRRGKDNHGPEHHRRAREFHQVRVENVDHAKPEQRDQHPE